MVIVLAHAHAVLLQIKMGGDVPEKYFFTNLENSTEDMELVTVNRGSSSQVQYEVDTPGTVLR